MKGAATAQSGNYTLSVADLTQVATEMGCGADDSAPDSYVYFDVANPAGRNVTVDMNGSTLSGVFELFNPSGTSLGCQTSCSSRSYTLPQGDN